VNARLKNILETEKWNKLKFRKVRFLDKFKNLSKCE